MRLRTVFIALATLALAPQASAAGFNYAEIDPPKELPEIAFEDRDGGPVTLADFEGRVVVLNLWATWCAPCRREMPALDRLQAAYGGPDFEVVALSVDRGSLDNVLNFLDEVGVEHLEVYRDPTMAASRTLRAPGLPTTVVIDREGREVGRVLGDADWDGAEAFALVEALIAR